MKLKRDCSRILKWFFIKIFNVLFAIAVIFFIADMFAIPKGAKSSGLAKLLNKIHLHKRSGKVNDMFFH